MIITNTTKKDLTKISLKPNPHLPIMIRVTIIFHPHYPKLMVMLLLELKMNIDYG